MEVRGELGLAGHEVGPVHPPGILAEDPEVLGRLQRGLRWGRELARPGHQVAVGQTPLGGWVLDPARTRKALGLGHAPGVRGGLEEHLPGLGAHFPQGQGRRERGLAAAGDAEIAEPRSRRGLEDLHLGPVCLERFRDGHGHAGADALAHLGARGPDGDGAVRIDAEHAAGLERRVRRLGRPALQAHGQGEGQGQGAGGLEEITAGGAHGVTPFRWPAARWMASRIRR